MTVTTWCVLGLVLICLEIFAPSFVVIWFGISALLTAPIAYADYDLTTQLAAYTILSVFSFCIGWFGIIKRIKAKSLTGQGKDSVIGERGCITSTQGSDFVTGIVQFQIPVLGDEKWPFISDAPVKVGDKVEITDVIGNKMKISKVN